MIITQRHIKNEKEINNDMKRPLILRAEFYKVLEGLTTNKAPGIDKIPVENLMISH